MEKKITVKMTEQEMKIAIIQYINRNQGVLPNIEFVDIELLNGSVITNGLFTHIEISWSDDKNE